MTYADHGSKDYEALLQNEELSDEPKLVLREKSPRSWALIHSLVLLTYSLLFTSLLYYQLQKPVPRVQTSSLIYCTSFV
jgi:hypothetical protein